MARLRVFSLILLALTLTSCTLPLGVLAPEPPGEGQLETDSASTVETGVDQAVSEVRIGLLLPGGEAHPAAAAARQGIELALEERDRQVAGLPVEIIEIDPPPTFDSPIQVATTTEELISQYDVHAVIGGLRPEDVTPAAVVAEAAATPFVALAAGDHFRPEPPDYVFPVAAEPQQQARALARFARQRLGAQTAAILYALTSAESYGLAEAFSRAFAEAGGSVVLTGGFEPSRVLEPPGASGVDGKGDLPEVAGLQVDTGDLDDYLGALAAAGPDVWYLPLPPGIAGELARRAQALGARAHVLGTDGWDSTSLQAAGGDAVAGAIFVTQFHPDRPHPSTEAFATAFRQRYGEVPTAMAALAYDGINLLLDGVAAAVASGRFDVTDTAASRTELQALLRQPGEYAGVTGRWLVGESEPATIQKSVNVVRVRTGPATSPFAVTEYLGEVLP